MKTKFVLVIAWLISAMTLSTVGLPSVALANTPLVDAVWVKSHSGASGKVFLDLRSAKAYQAGHVPGAIHTSYKKDHWRMKKGQIKGMLPSVEHLEKLIGRLGIDNETHVVVMHGGYSAAETGIATRVYWTFRVLGHDNVSILNGGMAAYLADKSNPVEKGMVKPVARVFKATLNKAVLATSDEVKDGLEAGAVLLDSRPTDQHMGVSKSSSVTRTGTLPGAISVPGRWVTINDKGTFRSISALKKLYAFRNVANKQNRIVFCNTGHWASLGWFVDSELLGNKTAKMYDGSMAQWSRLSPTDHPMTIKLNLQ